MHALLAVLCPQVSIEKTLGTSLFMPLDLVNVLFTAPLAADSRLEPALVWDSGLPAFSDPETPSPHNPRVKRKKVLHHADITLACDALQI